MDMSFMWCGLAFIAMQNDRVQALKINPHQPPRLNEGCRRIGREQNCVYLPIRQ
jgi:hypothetical protein